MQMLKSTKALKNEVNPHLDNVEYPRRELHGIIRFKTNDGEEVIKTYDNFGIKLQVNGQEKGLGVQELENWCEPIIETVPIEPTLRIGGLE